MDFNSLLEKLDNVSNENQEFYKSISGFLYFNDEKYLENTNFLNDNNTEFLYKIKKNNDIGDKYPEIKTDFKKINKNVLSHINFDDFNLSKKFDNLTDSILNILKFYNYSGKNYLFKKLLKDFDVLKLFKKLNYRKLIRKKKLRDLIIKQDDTNHNIKQFLVDYLNINLIIITNTEITSYCKEQNFELFRPTLLVYKHNETFYSLTDKITNKDIFLSVDNVNLKLKKFFINKILNNPHKIKLRKTIRGQVKEENIIIKLTPKMKPLPSPEIEEIKEKIEVIKEVKDYKKMNVKELKEESKLKKIKGYYKMKKQQLIDELEK
jgi:hypothetical protein